MIYRLLGNTGMKVSVIGFGTSLNSTRAAQELTTQESVKKAFGYGINFFDTGENYGNGEAERQLGNALKALNTSREDYIVSTKLFFGDNRKPIGVNNTGLSRKHIRDGLKRSLQRLQLDYADVVFAHRFDHETTLEEVATTFTELIKQGYINYWGTSEWSAANIFELREVCAEKGLIKPVVEQPQYNMFVREKFESEYARLFDVHKMGSTIWSPLCGGLLTGKYNDGVVPQGARFDVFNNRLQRARWESFFSEQQKLQRIQTLKGLEELAKELGMTQAQLAMAWTIANKDVSTAITGCSRPSQLDEIVESVKHVNKITREINERIDKILGNVPDQAINEKNEKQFIRRR
ncbi:hypothetical protein ABPG72_021654 [Tetrahymena utriculariae]